MMPSLCQEVGESKEVEILKDWRRLGIVFGYSGSGS